MYSWHRYLVNYSPFDLVYKLSKFLPFKLTIACLKEIQRAHKIQHGVQYAMKLYPGSYVIIGIIGVLKGKDAYLSKRLVLRQTVGL